MVTGAPLDIVLVCRMLMLTPRLCFVNDQSVNGPVLCEFRHNHQTAHLKYPCIRDGRPQTQISYSPGPGVR